MVKLLSVEDVARICGISRTRVYNLVRDGVIPNGVVVHLGRQIRFHAENLNAWIERGGQTFPGGWRKES